MNFLDGAFTTLIVMAIVLKVVQLSSILSPSGTVNRRFLEQSSFFSEIQINSSRKVMPQRLS
jgi:hypothetical protein